MLRRIMTFLLSLIGASQVTKWWRIHPQCRRPGFDPWVRKILWRRKWQPTPVFLPGKSHGQRSLADYSSWGCKESDKIEWLHFFNYFRAWLFVLFPFSVMVVLLGQRCKHKELRHLNWSQRSFCCVLCTEIPANKEESPDFPHYPSYIYTMACISQKLPSPSSWTTAK